MEVFEKKYTDDIKLEDAIILGLDALHSTTEGVFNASTIEVGIIELSTRKFRKLTPLEVEKYVERVIKMHASETKGKDKKKKAEE
jgi:proteasome alpha subunit